MFASSVVPRLFLACFFVNSFWGHFHTGKESFIFFSSDDIFFDARLRKEEERRKKSERTEFAFFFERERERSAVFSYKVYLLL